MSNDPFKKSAIILPMNGKVEHQTLTPKQAVAKLLAANKALKDQLDSLQPFMEQARTIGTFLTAYLRDNKTDLRLPKTAESPIGEDAIEITEDLVTEEYVLRFVQASSPLVALPEGVKPPQQ